MKLMLMMAALSMSACGMTVIDQLPCSPCKMKCEQDLGDGCDTCRSENCPDMTEEATDD